MKWDKRRFDYLGERGRPFGTRLRQNVNQPSLCPTFFVSVKRMEVKRCAHNFTTTC
jgi:hypothetical protein